MPLVDGTKALLVGLVAEYQGADDVEAETKGEANGDQSGPGPKPEAVELAHQQRGHEAGLEGANAAAGFVHADRAGAQFDEVAALQGGDVQPAEQFNRQTGDHLHQTLGQPFFDAVGPDDGDQDKADGEGKVADPRGEGESRDET